MGCGECLRTLRVGLLGRASLLWIGACSDLILAGVAVGEGRESMTTFTPESMFSWELGGSIASLLGTGVESLTEGLKGSFALGRELALVVSLRQEDFLASVVTFERGEDAGAGLEGVAFEKKEMMDLCLAEEEAAAGLVAFAGVRAAALSLAMIVVTSQWPLLEAD